MATIVLVQCVVSEKKKEKCLLLLFVATPKKGQNIPSFFVEFFFLESTCCSVIGNFDH